ncbi:sigma-54-dependent Fis family transcriptional regulator [Thalassobacillus sp. C254]|uniref:sigma-54 interaction domain-containing protein n=1 Tax=Thalassobacillus sp. C254 TaxID=1225341 RepID=UPI0006D02631|nr:sigma-54-dependent Fis family transcriptional regulator [Thalassobacillus sp. C254]
MKKAVIVGGGKGGVSLLRMLVENERMKVAGLADINKEAPGMKLALEHGIQTAADWRTLLSTEPDIIIEVTGKKEVYHEIQTFAKADTAVVPGQAAGILNELLVDKEQLIEEVKAHDQFQSMILNATHDGMIAIDDEEKIILFNRSAEEMTDLKEQMVLGRYIKDVIPGSELPRVLYKGEAEENQPLTFANGRSILSTRIPLWLENIRVGAFAVFRDVTEIERMAEEVTNLKSIQKMLEAIIHSSEEAISVVDENGRGMMINPAYTKITGLRQENVIGEPATADISEGESMHLKVLRTRKAVRGVRLKVGPNKRDVIVNVAPVIVDGKLKGSVGVIHDMSEIKTLTEELKRARQIMRTLEAKYTFDDIAGHSKEFLLAIQQAKVSAAAPMSVLLRGESGTGKELFAHAIHNESDRKFNKFIRVNCAALSESLLESELFGYEEGAFSGAKRGGKKGLFEEADKGSIFLDEIGEMTLSTQAKLLRVLQEGEIVRVGGTRAVQVDVRVIAATNVNLEKAIHKKVFREDLYYRINKLPIFIPPLRERREDIAVLSNRMIEKINQDFGRTVEGITEEAIAMLKAYSWPGNVRELENVLGRAVITMPLSQTLIDSKDLPPLEVAKTAPNSQLPSFAADLHQQTLTLQEQVENFEKRVLLNALKEHEGNKTKTAKQLGVSIRNLYYKLKKHGIEENSMQ